MWKRRAGWRDREFYPWFAGSSAAMLGTLLATGSIGLMVPAGGFQIIVGGVGLALLGAEWLVIALTQPRKDDMDDFDFHNCIVKMLDGS